MDAHDERELEVPEVLDEPLDRGVGTDGETRLRAGAPDLVERAARVRHGLDVDREVIGARIGISRDPVLRALDHEMDVERQVGALPQVRDHFRSEGEVRNEVSVHNVDVDPVGARGLGLRDRLAEGTEIGREDGWGELQVSISFQKGGPQRGARASYECAAAAWPAASYRRRRFHVPPPELADPRPHVRSSDRARGLGAPAHQPPRA
jgi:hypothetical protein